MYRLDNRIKEYAWGSRTAIAELLGQPIPSARPQAELWLGAHPMAPSRALRDGRWESLFDLITRDPQNELGPRVVSEFGPRLPFLFKVLAADQPLSLQAHPDAEQARAGFEDEERRLVPLDAPERSYKDRYHKPELICALGPFDMLCGFRKARDSVRLLRALRVNALEDATSWLELEPDARGLRRLVAWLFAVGAPLRAELVLATLDACAKHVDAEGEFARECRWVLRVGSMYPGDIGVVIALLLNLVSLEAGQAVFLASGNLHAYLKGVGLEIMANSDNVLRGGLTPKHVDVEELMRVLTFADEAPRVTSPMGDGPEQVYEAPASEFRLSRIALRRSVGFESGRRQGPEILLCIEGSVAVTSGHDVPYALGKGGSLFVEASSGAYALNGEGTVFRATVGAL